MNETPQDLRSLQELLDRSYNSAGEHLRSIHTPQRRMSALEVSRRLVGMRLLVLTTVSADCRPFSGPVDGVFHRGALHFGTGAGSLRWRHLLTNPAVSATHLPGEEWAVTVHGSAHPVSVDESDPSGLRRTLLEVYRPIYGDTWEQFLDSGPVYARIDAHRMFAIDVTGGSSKYSDPGETR